MKKFVRCACYVRVSTENQLENYSIDEQIDRLTSYCKAKDYTIVNFYTDGGYSGGNTNRPALNQMLRDIRSNLIDTVIVYKLDRLSRSQKDTLTLIEDYFLSHNVDFVSVNENFDTSTPFGRAMIGILSVFAQLEKDQITERFTMGRIARAKEGYYHGGSTSPVGYDYIDGRLVVNEFEAMQVQELFERFAKGYPLHNCWRYMQERYTTKYGAWKSEALVRSVLKNKVYIGYVKFGGVLYPGKHAPIISEELYNTVQTLFTESRRNTAAFLRSPFKAGTLLSGMIHCEKCGSRFHGEHGNYTCYSRSKTDKKYVTDPNCKNKKWRITDLDQVIIDFILGLCFEEENSNVTPTACPEPNYNKRISYIDRQISKLIDLYQIGSIPMDTISAKMDALTYEKNTLINRMETAQNTVLSIAEKIAFKNRLLSLLEEGSLPEKRACLAALINKIVIVDEDIVIELK